MFHAHVHVIPRDEGDRIAFEFPQGDLDDEEATRVVDAITDEL